MSSKSLNKDMILYQFFTIKVALQIYVNHMLLLKVTMNYYPISMHKPKVKAEGKKKNCSEQNEVTTVCYRLLVVISEMSMLKC